MKTFNERVRELSNGRRQRDTFALLHEAGRDAVILEDNEFIARYKKDNSGYDVVWTPTANTVSFESTTFSENPTIGTNPTHSFIDETSSIKEETVTNLTKTLKKVGKQKDFINKNEKESNEDETVIGGADHE